MAQILLPYYQHGKPRLNSLTQLWLLWAFIWQAELEKEKETQQVREVFHWLVHTPVRPCFSLLYFQIYKI